MTSQILPIEKGLRYRWLFGQRADFYCFFLPLLFGIAAYAASPKTLVTAIVAGFIFAEVIPALGTFHIAGTIFHFFDRKNSAYYLGSKKNVAIFLVIPTLLYMCTVGGEFLNDSVVKWIYMLWTVQHLTQQNVGILLLYRDRSTSQADVSRGLEALSVQLPAVLFTGLFFLRISQSNDQLLLSATAASIIIVCVSSLQYLIKLFKDPTRTINLPALAFWFIAVWFFLPLAILKMPFAKAALLPLLVHYCQYIGLNFILIRRKYGTEGPAQIPGKHPTVLFFVLSVVIMTALLFCSHIGNSDATSPAVRNFLLGNFFAFSMLHYYLDAFIWRFREQHQREAILPYLKAFRQPAVESAG